MAHVKKVKTISDAAGLKDPTADLRVVMPTKIASSVMGVVSGKEPNPLVYSQKDEDKNSHFNWQQLEELSGEMAQTVCQTAEEFNKTKNMIVAAGAVKDRARFMADVDVMVKDLERFTDEFCSIQKKHEGRNGFIETSEDRMLYLTVFEDYRAFGAFFQGTMHHKLMDFTEYALDAKDILTERLKEEASDTQPVKED